MKENKIVVGPDREGQRIDNFLLGYFDNIPKTRIYKALRKGEVRVDSRRIKPFYKVKSGDIIRVPPFFKIVSKGGMVRISDSLREGLLSRILYHDDSVLIIDKPAGLAVHGGSGVDVSLIGALRLIFNDFSYLELAHRIDRQTSGCLILAKSRQALLELHGLFTNRCIDKRYVALIEGLWPSKQKEIDLPLRRSILQSGERMVFVDPEGKSSLTRLNILQPLEGMSVVEACPMTGRTHQIRVHLAACGHPIAGDTKYGDDDFNKKLRLKGIKRLMLHAQRVEFKLDSMRNKIQVVAPLPSEFKEICESSR